MRRYTITLGSPTTAGGRVSSAGGNSCIEGMPIALEGDTVACPACASTGKILCVGPRIPETWHGRHVALENDLCNCRCPVPPKLLASQTRRCQVLKDTGRALSSALGPPAGIVRWGRPSDFGSRLVLLDAGTGVPLAHQEYAVVRQNGSLEFGTSDAIGRTHLLASARGQGGSEVYDIYL